MQSRFKVGCLLSMATLCLVPPHAALAAVPLGEYFSLSGFGTLAATATDTDSAEYVREQQSSGATNSVDFGVDSNLGLQLTGRANSWLSATVQTLTKKRNDLDSLTQVEWAFAKVTPLEGLAIRGGRMALPMFAVSDFRNVGYANAWMRPPNEVYGLALLDGLDGADLSYGHDLWDTTLTVSVLGGSSGFIVQGGKLDVEKVKGFNAQWETPWATFRVGQVQGEVQFPVGSRPAGLSSDIYTFSGAGVIVNHGNILAQAEYVRRKSDCCNEAVGSDGWYVLAGYRFGDFQPYASYATTKPTTPGQAFYLSSKQTTQSIGVRWNVRKSVDVKVQLDHIDTDGTPGISFVNTQPDFDGSVNVLGLSVDFVF